MNILIPHHWLLDHLKTTASPAQIQKYLSLCGPSVERTIKVKGQPVYDIEVTTNRVDMMSVRGIAREAAAILPEFNIPAKLKPLNIPSLSSLSTKPLALRIVNDPKLCHRILAIKLKNTIIKASPKWLQDRLIEVGQRPLNNVIDITNYITWEIGHPIHAFDYDRLKNKTIIIRLAQKGETLTTLDDQTHTMVGGEVVFDDGTGEIIDLPGIMGTKNTVVTNQTKNVLLWIESVVPEKIRFTSMTHAIRSQAAVLNEKSVDPELGLTAILRAVSLYQKITKAQLGSKLVDIYPQKPNLKTTTLTQKLLDTYLGIQLKPQRVIRILKNLGCQVKTTQHSRTSPGLNLDKLHPISYSITPPTWRAQDLTIPAEYVEEIARIYGYHNLPSVVMATPIPDTPPDENFKLEHQIKQWLADWGLQEVYTYSMVSKPLVLQSGNKLKDHLKIKNSLSDDWVYLRRSLIPSHLQVITDNQNKELVSIFEMANVYHPKKNDLPHEELQLTITTTQKYSYLKGILDALLQKLFITNTSIIPVEKADAPFIDNQTAEIYADKTFIGYIGGVGYRQKTYCLELLVKPLLKVAHTHPRYIPVIATPPIIEDLTFTLPPKTYLGEVIETISKQSQLIESVDLTKTYQQNYTFQITYRNPKKSLTDKDILPLRKKIVSALKKSFSAALVGKLE
jgi:phenylalanyl-tRNA synthetase beta chain